MQCYLHGVLISEVPKFLAESTSVMTHALELTIPFNTTHTLIIPLQLGCVNYYFDVHSLSIAQYENEDIFIRFILLTKNLHRIHQQMNIQKERLKC